MVDAPTHSEQRERDNEEVRARGLMPLDDAAQLLEDQVVDFFNEMHRSSVKEMSPCEWFQSFEKWLDQGRFEADYRRNMEWIKDRG